MGRIHSIQSFGGADGPGLRCVVFLQGCPLRCAYCHNPDAWDSSGGTQNTVEEVLGRVLRYKPYFGSLGGVTLSGGEPLMQPEFTSQLLARLHCEGIHTAIDTSGTCAEASARLVLENTDLVLCDIKFPSEEGYREYCGGSLETVLRFLRLTEEYGVRLWVRHVVVPGITDSPDSVKGVIKLACEYSNLERIELLPFRKLCRSKYKELGMSFPLDSTPECDAQTIKLLNGYIPCELRSS